MATTISTKRTRRQDLDKADLDEIENTPELVKLKQEFYLQIKSYKMMFMNYTGRGAAITVNAMSRYTSTAELKNKVHDQDKVDPALERIQALGSSISKTWRQLKKNMDREKKADARHKQLETSHSTLAFPGTVQDCQGVRDVLNTAGAKSVINHADVICVTGSSSDLAGTKEPLGRFSASVSGSSNPTTTASSGSAGPSSSASTPSHLTAVVSSTISTAAEPVAGPSSSAFTSSHLIALVSSTISTAAEPVNEKYLTGTSANVELDTTNLLSFFNDNKECDLQLDTSVDIVRCHSSLINHAGKNPKRVEPQPSTVNEDDPIEFLAQGLQTQVGPDGIISVDVPAVDALTKAVPKDNLDLVHVEEARKAFLRFLVFPWQVE
ncbi:hypothetical protein GGX14DRAFT_560613 [Mycena pura]|uniref:Uncharacterized protein n=1 Tax=Mycena pura TaxID=153505 RepID=A0AAD6VQ69_9AGAR|nr:hypothetical protein GGX14DRAFT_560613 [Mycena pura]